MFDYLQKFNNLPPNLRDSVSSPAAMAVIAELENKYKIDLAALVMKVMVKMIPLADLSIYFVSDFSLSQETAKNLTSDLKERLFFPVANYLGYNASYSKIVPKTAPMPVHLIGVERVIKASGIVFAGVELNSRFKNILSTYLKGIRSRIDTRLTLNKDIASGGLGLDYQAIDKIFKLADEVIAGQTLPTGEELLLPAHASVETAKSGLDKVRALYEKNSEARDIPYDLKKAISSGAIKKSVAPVSLPVPVEAKEKLLVEPERELKIAAAPIIVKSIEPIRPEEKPVTPEIKLETKPAPILNTPKINPVVINVPIVPVKTVSAVAASVVASKAAETIKVAQSVAAISPKINQPPTKQPGLLARLFHKEAPKKAAELPVTNTKPELKQPLVDIKAAPVVLAPKIPVVTPTIPNVKPSIASLRVEAAQNKPVVKTTPVVKAPISVVKEAPKVMGPIDELHYLDIVNFRRFGSNPVEATNKVEEKIRLLEKEGYDKMVTGVLAWRDGMINSIYLKMGEEALIKGVSFKQLADDYKNAKNPSYLFWEEIEAIMALNSRLMF